MLLDDIAVYEHILNGEDPEALADEYAKLRAKGYKNKMEIAKRLGWFK